MTHKVPAKTETDAEDYLIDFAERSEAFASAVAREEGIVLLDEHRRVSRFVPKVLPHLVHQ